MDHDPTAERFPSPNFTADRTNGTAPLTVRFTDTSSEFAYDWHWTFGDGTISTEQNPVHTFLSPGVYPVNLTIDEHDHWVGDAWVHYWTPPTPWPKTVNVTVEGPGPDPGLAIPGRIQAEDYNTGGEGVAYHDTTAGNSGGAYRTTTASTSRPRAASRTSAGSATASGLPTPRPCRPPGHTR